MISKRKLLRILESSGHRISSTTFYKYMTKELCQCCQDQDGVRTPYYDESIIQEIITAHILLDPKTFGYKSKEIAIARYIYLHRKEYGLYLDSQLPSWQDFKSAAKIIYPRCSVEDKRIVFGTHSMTRPYDMISVYADYKNIFNSREEKNAVNN